MCVYVYVCETKAERNLCLQCCVFVCVLCVCVRVCVRVCVFKTEIQATFTKAQEVTRKKRKSTFSVPWEGDEWLEGQERCRWWS